MRRSTPPLGRTAVAVGVAAVLGALWWAVRAPLVEHHAVAAPAEVDIDPPALRVRRNAAIALAMTPDDPWTFAESLAASAPSQMALPEDCGIDARPAFGPAGGRGTARGQAAAGASLRHAGTQARIDAELRTSLDPFERAVADWLDVGNMRGGVGRDEAVVQQATVSADARLYALAVALCHANRAAMPSCGSISLSRWIELDGDNGMPWLSMLEQAHAHGDAQGVDTALAHLASANRFDTYRGAAAGAVAHHATRDEQDLAGVHDLALKAAAEEALLAAPATGALMFECRDQAGADTPRARTCRAISDAMFAHSDSLGGEALAGALLLESTGDESRRDAILAERALAAAHWSPATGFAECRDLRDRLEDMVRVGQVGELQALREQMRSFVPP